MNPEIIQLKHKLKRFIQKVGIKSTRMMNPINSEPLSTSEREALIIFRKLLGDPDSELLTSPLSGKFYLRSPDRGMLLVLGVGNLSIVNHVYGYDVRLSQKSEKMLIDVFLNEVENRRKKMEEEYNKNIQHSLKTIIENLHEKV